MTVQMASDPNLFSRPQTVRAGGRRVTFDPADDRQPDGSAAATGRRLPRGVLGHADSRPCTHPRANGDLRVLGVHFLAFRYTAP